MKDSCDAASLLQPHGRGGGVWMDLDLGTDASVLPTPLSLWTVLAASFFRKQFKPLGACLSHSRASIFLPGHFIPGPDLGRNLAPFGSSGSRRQRLRYGYAVFAPVGRRVEIVV